LLKFFNRSERRSVLDIVLWKVIPPACFALLIIWIFVAVGGQWLFMKRAQDHLAFAADQQTVTVVGDVEELFDRLRDVAGNALTRNAFLDPLSVEHFLEPFFRTLRFGAFETLTIAMTDFSGHVIASNAKETIADDRAFIDTGFDIVLAGDEFLSIVKGSLILAVPIRVGSLPEGGLFMKLSPEDTSKLLSSDEPGALVWMAGADNRILHGSPADDGDDYVFSRAEALPSFPSLAILSAVPAVDRDGLLSLLHGFLFFAFLFDLAALVFGIYMAASQVAQPVNKLIAKIQSFEGLTGPDARLATDGPDEIANLAQAFNNATHRQTELTGRLEEALSKEQELNKQQRQFVSLVSHEFRTPLAVIDGNAQRVQRKIETMPREGIDKALKKTRAAVNKLIGLMETVLSSAKIEEGKIEFNPDHCQVVELLMEAIENQQGLCSTHQINVDIDQLPQSLIADVKLISHVFTNLLSNAVKYSPNAGAVWVKGYADGEKAVISVRDEGVGIPDDQINKLFGQFFRARTSQGISGTGIGLNLVKKIVEMHGGTVQVKSIEGEGSTFEVTFPIAGPPPKEALAEAA